jgi:hypothetical protein
VKRLTDAEVAALIARVGSPDYREREAATVELRRRPEAEGAVGRALAAADTPEVARRLGDVYRGLRADWANRRLAKLPEYVRRRQFDRLVETMIACREHLTSDHDKHVRAFLKGVYADATDGKPHRSTSGDHWIDFGTFAWSLRIGHTPADGRVTIIDRTARVGGLGMNVVATDWVGKVAPNAVAKDGFSRCVILCNGDVCGFDMYGGVLITTGTVDIWGGISRAFVVSLGDVVTRSVDSSVVVGRGHVERRRDRDSIVRDTDEEFFRRWEMFSAADTGAELTSVFGVALIQHVTPASPFGLAGVQVGDVLAQVDGTPVRSVRDAHRLLCRAAVTTGDATVVAVGAGLRRELVVHLQSW